MSQLAGDEPPAAQKDLPTQSQQSEPSLSQPNQSQPNQKQPQQNPEAKPGRTPWSLLREVGVMLVMAIVLSLIVKTFFVQAFYIPSGSMEPVLHGCDTCLGDRVLVNKLTDQMGGIHRGDIVVFHDSDGWLAHPFAPDSGLKTRFHDALTFIGLAPAAGNTDLVKRVIGVGGDTVEGRGGEVYVNGTQLHEPYVNPDNPPNEIDFTVTVPVDTLWVMGDNRAHSGDSRFHQDGPGKGFIPVKEVAGRVVAIVWPPNRVSSIP